MSFQDWEALHQAVAEGGGSYLSALNAQQQSLKSGFGSPGGGATVSGNGATSTASNLGQDAITAVQNAFPDLAWLLAVPDVAPLIVSAANTNMSEPQFTAEFESTPWFQTHSQAVRNWINLVQTDPSTAQAQTQQQQAAMQATLEGMGLNPNATQTWALAVSSLAQNLSDQQIRDQIAAGTTVNADGTFTFSIAGQSSTAGAGVSPSNYGTFTALQQNLTGLSKQYLVNASPQYVGDWVKNALTAGQSADQTAAAFTSALQNAALSQFPWMKEGIQAGQTPLALVSPYATMLNSELGVNANNIDWTQPQYGKLLSTPDPNTGVPVQKPIWQATQEVRSDPSYGWQSTPRGISAAYSFVQGMQATMGQKSYAGVTPGSVPMPTSFGSSGA